MTLVPPTRRILSLLDRPEELGLQLLRQLADLVEEERAAVGLLAHPRVGLRRSGERAAFVAEKLALDERRGDRPAVEDDERAGGARARAVDGLGDDLLARPGLALDEQRDVRGRDALQIREELAHAGGGAEQVSEAVARGLLALDGLREGRQGELGVAQAKARVRRQDGVVEARALGEDSVGRSQVAHAHPARDGLELAVGARHAVVVEDQVIVVGGADLHALPRDFQRRPLVRPAHHLDARLRVAHDDARTAHARRSRAGRLRHLLRHTTRRARRRPGGCGRIAGVQPEAKAVRRVGGVRRMGRYTLYGKIASGGMATLHFGRLLGPSGFARTVAVKCLHAQFAQDPQFSAMFLDEARLASRIRSPYVVPTLDVVSEEGELAIVMEYVHGQSLATLVGSLSDTDADRGSPAPPDVPVAVAVSVLGDVLQGLHAAHEARDESGSPLGIVHRDVSPQNILVGTDGLAHLIDFGVAKATGRLQTTREGQLKGKLAYMPPEQLRGETVTRRSDLYAAAVVLWEMLVGQRLFRGADEGATVTRVLMGEVRPPSKAARENRSPADVQALERLDAVVMRGLDRDPCKRFETAHDMAVALERCLAPAGAAEVAHWLEQVAGPALARRAAAIAAIESGAPGGSTAVGAADLDEPAQPTADASSLSVVSGVTAAPSSGLKRRVQWGLAAGVLAAAAVTATRIPSWSRGAAAPVEPPGRSSIAAPPAPAAAPRAVLAREPGPAATSPTADALPPSNASSSSAPAPPAVASPPRRGPAAPHASDCNPPFTWDDQGKKHYKRNCL